MNTTMQTVKMSFDPMSKNVDCYMVEITPATAQYILDHHNNNNRKLKRGQVVKIIKSIEKDGWMFDGQPITFDVDGNLTEGQHRLHAIVETGVTAYEVAVTTGVSTDCFTTCAPAKPRGPKDEVQRKDKTATDDEVTTLRQVLKRRHGERLTMQNAVKMWNDWKTDVRMGETLTRFFFDDVKKMRHMSRVIRSWAALMSRYDDVDLVTDFLDLLRDEILGKKTHCLTRQFREQWKEIGADLSAEDRTKIFFAMLCVATDDLKKDRSGDCEFSVMTEIQCSHEVMKRQGVYRKFLDPSSI